MVYVNYFKKCPDISRFGQDRKQATHTIMESGNCIERYVMRVNEGSRELVYFSHGNSNNEAQFYAVLKGSEQFLSIVLHGNGDFLGEVGRALDIIGFDREKPEEGVFLEQIVNLEGNLPR